VFLVQMKKSWSKKPYSGIVLWMISHVNIRYVAVYYASSDARIFEY